MTQVLFNSTFAPSSEWILEYRRDLEAKLGPLSREIVGNVTRLSTIVEILKILIPNFINENPIRGHS